MFGDCKGALKTQRIQPSILSNFKTPLLPRQTYQNRIAKAASLLSLLASMRPRGTMNQQGSRLKRCELDPSHRPYGQELDFARSIEMLVRYFARGFLMKSVKWLLNSEPLISVRDISFPFDTCCLWYSATAFARIFASLPQLATSTAVTSTAAWPQFGEARPHHRKYG